jgi:aminobenzoyl-glutamate utilization protein B
VVPAFAEVFYYVRHPEMSMVKEIFERVAKAAEGAALGTGTTMDYEVIHGAYNLMPNETLARLMDKNLRTVGGITYTEEEKSFATKIQATFTGTKPALETAKEIQPFRVEAAGEGSGGSTDVGDVSWAVPTAGMGAATFVPGTAGHSWQAVAAGGTSIGTKGMIVAAKTLALTAYDIFKNPAIVEEATKELAKKRGENFKYEALLGDRKPPLDYRK